MARLGRGRPNQAIIVRGGIGSPDVSVNLTGQSITATAGTLSAAISYTLTGQSASFAQGTVTNAVAYTLSGQSITSAQWTIVPAIAYTLTGQAATFAQGTITTGNDVNVTLTGQSASFTAGNLTGAVAYTLSGQSGTFAHGTVTPAVSQTLSGQSATFAQGTLGASVSGDVSVSLTGIDFGFQQGTITATGGDSAAGGDAWGGRQKKRFVQQVGGKLVVFNNAGAAIKALVAEEARLEKEKRLKKPIPAELPPTIEPEDVEDEVLLADVQQVANILEESDKIDELLRRKRYEDAYSAYMAMMQIQQDEAEVEMLLMAL